MPKQINRINLLVENILQKKYTTFIEAKTFL
jgi:hypothetical protein